MNNKLKNEQYRAIVDYILKTKYFNIIESFPHHGTNRLQHSIRVSYYSYIVSKTLGLDYKAAAISGLLHDFYLGEDDKGFKKYLKFQRKHPKIAAYNALKYFAISKKVQNIIETHMWPFTKISKYPEGWVITLVDKSVALYEYAVNVSHLLILRKKATKS